VRRQRRRGRHADRLHRRHRLLLNIESIRQAIQALSGTELFNAGGLLPDPAAAVVDPREVMQVVGMGLGLSLLATIYPSWRAAKTDPVVALRNE
jgi:lipoprotein-releasing system permease protein